MCLTICLRLDPIRTHLTAGFSGASRDITQFAEHKLSLFSVHTIQQPLPVFSISLAFCFFLTFFHSPDMANFFDLKARKAAAAEASVLKASAASTTVKAGAQPWVEK